MSYPARSYAEALLRARRAAGPRRAERLAASLVRLLVRTGDIANAKKIVAAIEQALVRERGGRWIEIELARPQPASRIAALRRGFGPSDHIGISMNPALIAGARIRVDDQLEFDSSFARRLRTLFASGSEEPT